MTPEQIAKLPRIAREYIAWLERQVEDDAVQIKHLAGNPKSSIMVTGVGPVDPDSPIRGRCLYLPEKVRPRFRVLDPKYPGHNIEVVCDGDRTLEISTTIGHLLVMPQVANVIRVAREAL